MDTAKKYIDSDDAFFLHRINCLDLFLKCGITMFVDEFKPNFHDMTLIQYAIAKRKPKTLKDMLEASYYQCQVPFKNILTPETSNTKGNLLNLAIEFGSENVKYGENYNKVDIECLKVIVEFGKKLKGKEDFNIDMENINGETPLIVAINHQNTEACKYLIENGADILHECNNYLKNPLWCLLVKAKNLTILMNLINNTVLDKKTYSKVHHFCDEIDKSKEKLDEINNEYTTEFFEKIFKGLPPPLQIDQLNDDNKEAEPTTQEPEQQGGTIRCHKCGKELQPDATKKCDECGLKFCEGCVDDHNCSHSANSA